MLFSLSLSLCVCLTPSHHISRACRCFSLSLSLSLAPTQGDEDSSSFDELVQRCRRKAKAEVAATAAISDERSRFLLVEARTEALVREEEAQRSAREQHIEAAAAAEEEALRLVRDSSSRALAEERRRVERSVAAGMGGYRAAANLTRYEDRLRDEALAAEAETEARAAARRAALADEAAVREASARLAATATEREVEAFRRAAVEAQAEERARRRERDLAASAAASAAASTAAAAAAESELVAGVVKGMAMEHSSSAGSDRVRGLEARGATATVALHRSEADSRAKRLMAAARARAYSGRERDKIQAAAAAAGAVAEARERRRAEEDGWRFEGKAPSPTRSVDKGVSPRAKQPAELRGQASPRPSPLKAPELPGPDHHHHHHHHHHRTGDQHHDLRSGQHIIDLHDALAPRTVSDDRSPSDDGGDKGSGLEPFSPLTGDSTTHEAMRAEVVRAESKDAESKGSESKGSESKDSWADDHVLNQRRSPALSSPIRATAASTAESPEESLARRREHASEGREHASEGRPPSDGAHVSFSLPSDHGDGGDGAPGASSLHAPNTPQHEYHAVVDDRLNISALSDGRDGSSEPSSPVSQRRDPHSLSVRSFSSDDSNDLEAEMRKLGVRIADAAAAETEEEAGPPHGVGHGSSSVASPASAASAARLRAAEWLVEEDRRAAAGRAYGKGRSENEAAALEVEAELRAEWGAARGGREQQGRPEAGRGGGGGGGREGRGRGQSRGLWAACFGGCRACAA